MLIFAIVSITLALAFYSVGVWSEQAQHTLKGWHLFMFWAGLADQKGPLAKGAPSDFLLFLTLRLLQTLSACAPA
jgi:hypothetical protein